MEKVKINTVQKKIDTVKVFRKIKEKIAKETESMTFEQFKAYLNANKVIK